MFVRSCGRGVHLAAAEEHAAAGEEEQTTLGWTCEACTFANEDTTAAACAVCGAGRPAAAVLEEEAALREPARAATEWRANMAAAVATRKAAAPLEVRAVLDGGRSGAGQLEPGTAETERVFGVVAGWLVGAHAAAHDDPATKRLARLVLGKRFFAANMSNADVWDEPYKAGLQRELQALGAPLAVRYMAEGLRHALGDYEMEEHALVKQDRERRPHLQAGCKVEAKGCDGRIAEVNGDGTYDVKFFNGERDATVPAAGIKYELRSDIDGIVPVPAAWAFGVHSTRKQHERVFIHMLKMIGMALNGRFHELMREVLGPHCVAGAGLMQKKGGTWFVCAEKGVARMECKRVTDHGGAPGCRPALNIDVLRILGVCETAEQMLAAMAALKARFAGCGRVKNGFKSCPEKAAQNFDLRVLMGNFVVGFGLTFGQLAEEPAVKAMWKKHVEQSPPEGGAPRGRVRAEAAEALAVLTSKELECKEVVFICEAQMVLRQTYEVRSHMHELYKGYRADSGELLHADMVSETRKVEAEQQATADGDTALKAACRDGSAAVAARLLAAGGVLAAERGAAFAVACARGREALLVAVPALAAGLGGAAGDGVAGKVWEEAWRRAASNDAEQEMGAGVVEALLGLVPELDGGVDFRRLTRLQETALLRAARGGHALAVGRLLVAGAAVDLARRVDNATPLFTAAENGHKAVVAALLAAGAAPDLADIDGATPLFMSAQNGHEVVAAVLLSAGATVDKAAANVNDSTPLFVAAENGHEEAVAVLLAAGAAVGLADSRGSTPLRIAAKNGHSAVVAVLLAAGADVHSCGMFGTPLSGAQAAGHAEIEVMLRAAGAT
jgi:hypothetical protein